MARIPFIAGNWKLNLTGEEGATLVRSLLPAAQASRAEIAVCPTALALPAVVAAAAGSRIGVGAQHCHWEDKGAFTGEISAPLIKAAGGRYVIIGHSERRQYFGETDATVNKRLQAVLRAGLVPIVCVGETLAERDAGQLTSVLGRQLRDGLGAIPTSDLEPLVIAYEPVWAIGTGRTASSAQAQEAHAFIRSVLEQRLGALAARVRIQYGGSVKADNAAELLSMPDVDGALVGGASLKAADFAAILAAA